ncbi:putative ubiquitin-protein ligase [Trypanosoma grayi]|uniref:putative ubiquitin-protein ligase n=1 Tax=Trypanosoma grayi TaxID=71804 RepID=UPI0004F416BC|nr:putative ubiquitin-protein ligase [Trypanosoma grayi]KEG15001.1 putative ubiquitin-protein ligase [Trypanosoma grayi]
MDDLSSQYLLMANGPQGQLHDPAAVVSFVDQMQLVLERSSAPRKNFLLDPTTQRGDVIITEATAMKPGNGWITLQVTEGIRRGVHEWCVKIEHQGETTDGSGLMLGIVPKSFAKYDSFISQGGGWCLSRAGKFYGHWRRQDTNASVVFGTGDRVTFTLDYEAARMTVRVGDKSVVGEISNLAPEVYPAVSLHYRHQFIRFEYHKVHDRHAKKLKWIERLAFPHAAVYLPLTAKQLENVPLDSYVFSPIFSEREGQVTRRKRRCGSASVHAVHAVPAAAATTATTTTGTAATTANNNTVVLSADLDEVDGVVQEYETPRAASARLMVVFRAAQAVRRYCSGSVTPTDAFLARNVTAEMLRKQWHALASRDANPNHGGMDAALNCGALVLVHMFSHASTGATDATLLPLVCSLQEYLRGIALFSLGESSGAPHHVGTSLSPEVVRLAIDNVAALLERAHTNNKSHGDLGGNSSGGRVGTDSTMTHALSELLVLLSLQCGSVSEVLRAVRYLLRAPTQEVSPATLLWLQNSEVMLTPKSHLPNLNSIYDSFEEETEHLTPFERDFGSAILSVGYDNGCVYVHTVDSLTKRSNVAGAYALVCATCEPRNCFQQCTKSSIAFNESGAVFLLTNRMVAAGLAVVVYSAALEIRQKVKLTDVPQWPLSARHMALASGPGDQILLVYEVPAAPTPPAAASAPAPAATAGTITGTTGADASSATPSGVEMQVFSGSSFPEVQWRTTLQMAPFNRTLGYCLTLRKGSVVDLGSPETCLATVGGHVTVELWIKILEKDDASVFYQHGDRSTSGEVFLETARLEGAWRIRGGYRHDSRGMCVVTAPVSLASESRFLHVALVFDGNWRLYFDNEEVSRTKQGPQVSLENPRQRWTAGNDCVCQLAALRVWKGGRSFREIVRDSRRLLAGDEPGLLCQYLFNEQNGNIVYNHVRTGPALNRHAIVRGHFTRVGCFDHPLFASLRSNVSVAAEPASNTTATELPQLENTHVFFDGVHLGMMEQKKRALPGFPEMKHAHQVVFFNAKTGLSLNSSFVLRQKSKMGFLGCDHKGRYWELFHAGAHINTLGEQQQQQQEIVAVGTMSGPSVLFQERSAAAWRYGSDSLSQSMRGVSTGNNGGGGNSVATAAVTLSSCSPQQSEEVRYEEKRINIHGPILTFGSLALWLLNILSSFAETSDTVSDHQLFSPLLDDVSVRCVQETQHLLREHCRAVRALNSRRSANLKDNTSSAVIATALRILVRVIRRVRDFKLHPDTIMLSEVSGGDDLRDVLHELSIIQRRRSAGRQESDRATLQTTIANPRKGGLMDGAPLDATQRRPSLLGVLADIINEAGFNLPAELAVLARVIIQEGVTLFFPSATVRAKLLREILGRDQQSMPRSPALNVLLDAIVKSFTEITSAAALVRAADTTRKDKRSAIDINSKKKNEFSGGEMDTKTTDEKLLVIKTTLSTLMTESARQMTSQVPNEPRHHQLGLLAAMAEAIGTLQLLLFSQCGGIGTAETNGTGMQRGFGNVFSIPQPPSLDLVLKEYYRELFDTAEMTFKTLAQRLPVSPQHSAAPAAMAMMFDIVGVSFLGSPLHAAVTALPLMVTQEESDWFLEKLNSLRSNYNALLQLIRVNYPVKLEMADRWPLPVLDTALLLASSWVASFMCLGQLTSMPSGTNVSSFPTPEDANDILAGMCDHPLLSAGLGAAKTTGKAGTIITWKLLQKRVAWETLAGKDDPLASKTPAEVSSVISLAAVAAVHLSGAQLDRLTENERVHLLARTLLRLRSARNELLNRRSTSPNEFSRNLSDVQERCQLLLQMKRVVEVESTQIPSLFLAHSYVDKVLRGGKLKGMRWRRAFYILRAKRLYNAAHLHGWWPLNVDAAVELVERIILSSEVTAPTLKAAIEARELEALRRLAGLQHMLRLFKCDPLSASKVASLLFNGAVGSRLHFETGISGCSDATRCAVRHTMYDILRHLCDITVSLIKMSGGLNKVDGGAEKTLGGTAFHSATFSEVLNRNWLPSDFCYFNHLRVAEVVFRAFCSIFDSANPETLRHERATERTHRYDAKGARKQASVSNAQGPTDDEASEVSFQRTPYETALMESLKTLKSLGLQCAVVLGNADVSPSERRGCILFLDQLFEVIEAELHGCAKCATQMCSPTSDRVLEQVSLLCTLSSTVARALPDRFLCNDEMCSSAARLAFRLCVMAKVLSTTTPTNAVVPNLADACLYSSALLLRHCQPALADTLFRAEETMEVTRQGIRISTEKSATLGFFFAFALRCVSTGCILNEMGLRNIDALHTLVCEWPWDDSFSALHEAFRQDLAMEEDESEGVARINALRLLVWTYTLGGEPTRLLGFGRKVRMSVDDALTTTEPAYIVESHPQSNMVTVLPASSVMLLDEREVLLDSIINVSQEEVTLPRADVLFRFLLPALEHFFAPAKQRLSPLIWAVVAALLRITLAVLRNDPAASQVLLEEDIISHVDNFAFRIAAKFPLPLSYLYEVCPTVVQQLLLCPRRIPFDAVVPSSSPGSVQNSPSSVTYSQPPPNPELHHLLPLGGTTPMPSTICGTVAAVNNSLVTRLETDSNNNNNNSNVLPSIVRLPQAHSSLCLTPSVLCFSVTKDTPGGTLTVKSSCKKSCVPLWTDGVTLEASVLLYDRLFPELGEDFVIPFTWQRPDIHFTLFSLYDKASTDVAPFMRVLLREGNVDCVMGHGKGATTIVSTKLLREDWDHWIHMAVVLESKTVTLYKDGAGTTAILPKQLGLRLEALLREGGADRLVIGLETRGGATDSNNNTNNNDESTISSSSSSRSNSNIVIGNSGSLSSSGNVTEGLIVALDSVRLWGCARTLKAQRTAADFVAREQTLPAANVADGSTFTFRFSEATGSQTLSENKECIGTLHGSVRWAPFPVFSGTVNLDKAPRTDSTNHFDLPLFIPRREFDAFFTAFERAQMMRVGGEYLKSLSAHLSRKCIVAAIRQAVSPAYRVLVLEERRKKSSAIAGRSKSASSPPPPPPPSSSAAVVVDPRHIISSTDLVRHLVNVLRYSDTGAIEEETMKAVSDFVKLWFRTIVPEKQLASGFREAAFAISEALHDEVESFCVELPLLSHVTTDVQLVPIATLNGPGGSISFDASSRSIEHMTLLRDRKQKVLLAKYPDAQGGWPELEIPNDTLWIYARPVVSTRSVAPSITVSARSLKPLVVCGIFGALRDVLMTHPRYHCGLAFFLNTPFVSLLTVRAGTTKGAAVPACRLLTALFELWRQVPHFAPHDQSPLKIMLAHLNVPLMSILHRGQISPSSPPLLSPAFGHYNPIVQSSFEVLVAAIRLEAAWKNVVHEHCTRIRWRRLYSLWERSIGYGTPSVPPTSVPSVTASAGKIQEAAVLERGYVRLMPLPSSGSPVQHRPRATIFQRGNGAWYASCDRGSLSARSSVGFKRGRFYFEVRIPAKGEAISVGVVTERAQQHSVLAPRGLGHDGDSWGFESAQMCRFYHGFRHEFAVRTKWKGLDVIGILLDLEAETLACVHEDRQVSLFDNIKTNRGSGGPTSFFPAVSFGTGGVDVNFGAAPFACSLPVGFLPVDPSNYMTSPTSKLWTLLAAVSVGEAIADNNTRSNNNNNSTNNIHNGDIVMPPNKEVKHLPILFEKADAAAMIYQTGRSGPFTASLLPCDSKTKMAALHGSEVRAEDDPCFVRGSVCVRSGRWYYEVILRGDALVSIGWATSTATADWSRSKALGDDVDSWVLEGSRTTARHNKHQRSVGGQLWKHGDVVGCMVDCDACTIAYSVNGVPLREVHDTNSDGILFTSVNCANGLMPVVGVDPKSAAAVCFADDELSFHPRGYRALSTSSPIRTALEFHYCTCDLEKRDRRKSGGGRGNVICGPLFSPSLARHLLLSLTALTELNFLNASAYCLEDILNRSSSTILYERFQGRENAMLLLVTLQNLTAFAECMIPYAHAAFLPGEYDTFLSGPICRSLRHCRDFMLPVVALRLLHVFISHTNSSGDNVKLTLNRRKALALVKDMNVPPAERLRGSLFGQVYQLLHEKNASLFRTSKKLWSVSFVGEGADDIGGPYRESITQLCSELMSPGLPLFIPSPNQINEIGESREVFVVRPVIEPPVRLTMYHFFGRLIAGCLRSAEPLPIYLPSRVWKALVRVSVDVGDLGMVDKASLQSYQYIRQVVSSRKGTGTTDDEIAELCPGGFSVVDDAGNEQELFPGGKRVSVDRHNVDLFLDMALNFKLNTMGHAQVKAVADGFHQVIPASAVSLLKWYELEQVVCGQPDYDADALLDSARYEDLDPNDTIVLYLRQVLRQFSRHERALFMRFVSGRERLPSGVRLKLMPDTHARPLRDDSTNNSGGGSGSGSGSGGGGGVTDVFDDNRLPHASTCFYWLSIPRYSSVEVMRKKLLFAIQQCLDIDADFVVHENDIPEDEVEPTLAVNVDEDEEEFEDFSHLR